MHVLLSRQIRPYAMFLPDIAKRVRRPLAIGYLHVITVARGPSHGVLERHTRVRVSTGHCVAPSPHQYWTSRSTVRYVSTGHGVAGA
eukprot:3907122-Rhodomonas_salina.1